MAQGYPRPAVRVTAGSKRTIVTVLVCAWAFTAGARAGGAPTDADKYWPQWRGPTANGVAPHGDPPIEWSESRNIRWKVEIPGLGHATPIVWGDRVYVQTAAKSDRSAASGDPAAQPAPPEPGRDDPDPTGGAAPTPIHEFILLAIDRRTGETAWQRTLCAEPPHEGGHEEASQASNSPVTDGEHIIACFGSRGLYCLDMQGRVVWQKRIGRMQTRRGFGEGSSPALHGDTIVVNWDHEGDDFIVALDKRTGKELWRAARDEPTSWATPLVVEHDGRAQVVTSATNLIRSYDLHTGELIWKCSGMTANAIPSPVSNDELVYAISGFRGSALLAIRYADARGDITDSPAVAWKFDGKGTPYVPSPLLYADTLYFLDSNRAALSCVDARSGKPHYAKQRLEGLPGVFASPVAAHDRVYVAGRNGATAVIRHGPTFEQLATNTLDDSFTASPAIVGHEIYLRGHKHLYCIATD